MKQKMIYAAIALCAILFMTACDDEIEVQRAYDFRVFTLPVPKRIKMGETVEIRCRIETSGEWEQAQYFLRYFQPDGKGDLRSIEGVTFKPNDRYELFDKDFRLYYSSHSEDQQTLDLYFLDGFDRCVTLSFTFNNDTKDEEILNRLQL